MTNYYKFRKQVLNTLEQTISENQEVDIDILYYALTKKYGITKRFLEKHLQLLEQLGRIEIRENRIINHIKNAEQKEEEVETDEEPQEKELDAEDNQQNTRYMHPTCL